MADYVGLVSFVFSIIGFVFTIISVRRAKTAAIQAREAADDVRKKLTQLSTVSDFSEALTMMAEVKRLHRTPDAMPYLPDRYASVKRLLVQIRGGELQLSEEHHATIQSAIQHFTDFDRQVEKLLQVPPANRTFNPTRANEILSGLIDKLNEIHIVMKRDLQEKPHG